MYSSFSHERKFSLKVWRTPRSPSACRPVRSACIMSTAVSCQEPSFVGGQRYDCPYSVPTSAESVDVSKETLVSFWAAGPLDNTVCLHEPSQQETLYSQRYESVPTWNGHLSPQLQRNKQLQDTLQQREEELARLQEENNKLKEFLNSSLVKCLEDKAKKLLSAQRGTGTRHRKRMLLDDGRYCRFNASQLLAGSQGKRTCRNLTSEFCSAEELAATPSMDSWVLQTLGLQDEDTIDPTAHYSTSINPAANFSSSIDPSAGYSSDMDSSASCSSHLNSSPNYRSGIISSVNCSSNINPSASLSLSINPSSTSCHNNDACTSFSPLASLPVELTDAMPLPDPLDVQPVMSSLPGFPSSVGTTQRHTPTPHCPESDCAQQTYPTPPGGSAAPYPTPSTPRGRTEVAFSMSLEPWNSVRTHSFPQGQAFVCRDTCGGWNFTWVPKDAP
ncbi:hypothetical protein AGOR_G00127410 [Albula goreensis]|uniref:Geminin coiled-coil domain-containing protein 1 n=1 Tax=Albula goreensis TaxID=1534307 RepID=A0A8T3DCF9_9TELE|nr:hypothetical protein AGOR_G00127410 [Albula goreensis]